MKTILLGFEDVAGRGQSTLLAGPNSPESEKASKFAKLKAGGTYPKDIERVEMWGEQRGRCGVAICIKAHGRNEEARIAEEKEAADLLEKEAAEKKAAEAKAAAEKAEAEAKEKQKQSKAPTK
jgi:hypothetical protein